MLTFVDGKLRSRAWDKAELDAQLPREIFPGLTHAAFEAIPDGTTTDEVRRTLGEPFTAVVAVSDDLSEELHWCYGKQATEKGMSYSFPMLTFVGGKLQRRAWYGPPWEERP